MPEMVVMTAMMKCSFGMAPSVLSVLSQQKVFIKNKLAGTIMDKAPMANIAPFGMCQSLANPTVASATAAAMGALTPMPCIPNIAAPWVPGAIKVKIMNKPALVKPDMLMCNWGGVIQINMPGNFTVKAN